MSKERELLKECLAAFNELPNTRLSNGNTYGLAAKIGKHLRETEKENSEPAMYLVKITPGGMADNAVMEGPFVDFQSRIEVAKKLLDDPENLVLSLDLRSQQRPFVQCWD